MTNTGKSKFEVKRQISLWGESKHKNAPDWLNFADKTGDKLDRKIDVNRSMLLDARKWKTKDIIDGCYAVARYELKLFSSQFAQIEKKLLNEVGKYKGAKFKNVDEIMRLKDIDKDQKLKKIFKGAASDALKSYTDISKKIEDKVSLALDEVEADKGDNKKSLSNCKEALRKFGMTDFKATVQEPANTAADAMSSLAASLKDPNKKTAPKQALEAASKTLKDAETEFEKRTRKARATVDSLLDLGDKLSNDKNADPSIRELGEKIGDKSQAAKDLEKVNADFDKLTKTLEKLRNLVGKSLRQADDEAAMKSLAMAADREAKTLKDDAAKCIGNIDSAKGGVKKFETEFKKVEKELKK